MNAAAASRMRATEVAARLERSPKTVREWARLGLIPALRIGPRGHYQFDPEAIEGLLASASLGRAVDAAHLSESRSSEARRGPASIEEGSR